VIVVGIWDALMFNNEADHEVALEILVWYNNV
jgi:hypothetical protein